MHILVFYKNLIMIFYQLKQLKKYDCETRRNYKVSSCQANAPKGWNNYYKNKLKLIEKKALQCIG